jgi:ketosteroid isomerase-like protein
MGQMMKLWLSALFCSIPSGAFSQEVDARVREVLESNAKLERAIEAGDADALAAHFCPEFRLQNASNRILTADQVIQQFRSGATRFSDYQRDVEAAYASGDVVVLMGQERVRRSDAAAGEPATTRRFTSVWRKTAAGWKQIARQATNVSFTPVR